MAGTLVMSGGFPAMDAQVPTATYGAQPAMFAQAPMATTYAAPPMATTYAAPPPVYAQPAAVQSVPTQTFAAPPVAAPPHMYASPSQIIQAPTTYAAPVQQVVQQQPQYAISQPAFQMMDSNHDGMISQAEFNQFVAAPQVAQMVQPTVTQVVQPTISAPAPPVAQPVPLGPPTVVSVRHLPPVRAADAPAARVEGPPVRTGIITGTRAVGPPQPVQAPPSPPVTYAAPTMVAAPTVVAAPQPQPTTLFDAMDRNKDGGISQAEFNNFMLQAQQPAPAPTYAAPAPAYAAPTYAAPVTTYSAAPVAQAAPATYAAPAVVAAPPTTVVQAPMVHQVPTTYAAPVMTAMPQQQAYLALDQNHDGVVSQAEFNQFMHMQQPMY